MFWDKLRKQINQFLRVGIFKSLFLLSYLNVVSDKTSCVNAVGRITAAYLTAVARAFHIAIIRRAVFVVAVAAQTTFAILHTRIFETFGATGFYAALRRIVWITLKKTIQIKHITLYFYGQPLAISAVN